MPDTGRIGRATTNDKDAGGHDATCRADVALREAVTLVVIPEYA